MTDNKCLGVLGLIFGHKYLKSTLEYTYRSEFCFRCGRRRGQE